MFLLLQLVCFINCINYFLQLKYASILFCSIKMYLPLSYFIYFSSWPTIIYQNYSQGPKLLVPVCMFLFYIYLFELFIFFCIHREMPNSISVYSMYNDIVYTLYVYCFLTNKTSCCEHLYFIDSFTEWFVEFIQNTRDLSLCASL